MSKSAKANTVITKPDLLRRLAWAGVELSPQGCDPKSSLAGFTRDLLALLDKTQCIALRSDFGVERLKRMKAVPADALMSLLEFHLRSGLIQASKALAFSDIPALMYAHDVIRYEAGAVTYDAHGEVRDVELVERVERLSVPFGEQVWSLAKTSGLMPVPLLDREQAMARADVASFLAWQASCLEAPLSSKVHVTAERASAKPIQRNVQLSHLRSAMSAARRLYGFLHEVAYCPALIADDEDCIEVADLSEAEQQLSWTFIDKQMLALGHRALTCNDEPWLIERVVASVDAVRYKPRQALTASLSKLCDGWQPPHTWTRDQLREWQLAAPHREQWMQELRRDVAALDGGFAAIYDTWLKSLVRGSVTLPQDRLISAFGVDTLERRAELHGWLSRAGQRRAHTFGLSWPDGILPLELDRDASGRPEGMWSRDALLHRSEQLHRLCAGMRQRLPLSAKAGQTALSPGWASVDDALSVFDVIAKILASLTAGKTHDPCVYCHRTRGTGGWACMVHKTSGRRPARAKWGIQQRRAFTALAAKWEVMVQETPVMLGSPEYHLRRLSRHAMALVPQIDRSLHLSADGPSRYLIEWDALLPSVTAHTLRSLSAWFADLGIVCGHRPSADPQISLVDLWRQHGPETDVLPSLARECVHRAQGELEHQRGQLASLAFEVESVKALVGPRIHSRMRHLLAWMVIARLARQGVSDNLALREATDADRRWLTPSTFWLLWLRGLNCLNHGPARWPWEGPPPVSHVANGVVAPRVLPMPSHEVQWLYEGADPDNQAMDWQNAEVWPWRIHYPVLLHTLTRLRAWEESNAVVRSSWFEKHRERQDLERVLLNLRSQGVPYPAILKSVQKEGLGSDLKLTPKVLRTMAERLLAAHGKDDPPPWQTGTTWS